MSHIINTAVREGNLKGVKLSRNGPTITHLLFADDMVLFLEAEESQVSTMMDCLNKFCSCSGQKVSLMKSQMFVSNDVNCDLVDRMSAIAGVPITKDLGRYLGVPSIHNRLTESTFAGVLDRIKDRLEGWRAKHLSLAGRHVMAQSVLSTIPYYAMQTARLPRSLCDNIDKRIRHFIWGGMEKERAYSLVSWDTVRRPRKMVA